MAPPADYTKVFGGTSSDSVSTVAVDPQGNSYAVGQFYNTILGMTSKGQSDWFVVKHSPTGQLLWSKSFGGTSWDSMKSIAVSDSALYVSGIFAGTVNFGGTDLVASGSTDLALVKLDPATGNHVWSKRFGGTADESFDSMKLDPTGNLVATGYFRGVINFGGADLRVPFSSDLDVFIVKFTEAGAHVFSKNFTNDGNDRGKALVVDGSGNIAIAGTFSNTINFGGSTLVSLNAKINVFLAKFNSTGTHLWSKGFGHPDGNEDARGLAVDGAGNLALTGMFSIPVDFGGGALNSNGIADGYLAYFGADGSFKWNKALGGGQNDYGNAVSFEGSDVLAAGQFSSAATFGTLSATAVGTTDSYVVRFSSAGVSKTLRTFGGRVGTAFYQHSCNSVAGLPGRAVLGGFYYGTWGANTAVGAADAYVLQVGM